MLLDKLKNRSYQEIEVELALVDTGTLLRLLDCASVRIGDTAAEILVDRKGADDVINALLADKIVRKVGKIRATNVLHRFGKAYPQAVKAYLALLSDSSPDVVDCALFGLVFMQDKRLATDIRNARTRVREHSKIYELYSRAVMAIEKQDPTVYSPYFQDAVNVWGLRKEQANKTS